jgi:hypothetical protein
MRLKLVIIAALLATIAGAGSSIAIILGAFASLKPLTSPGLFVLATLLLPIGAIVWASIFVYRHTARRRKLQAALTAILGLLLTLGAFTSAALLTARPVSAPATAPPPRNSG